MVSISQAAWDAIVVENVHLKARLAEAEADQRRFIWWMTVRDTGGRFLLSYRRGVAEGWSMDQWRTAIDEAMSATDSAVVAQEPKP